MLEKGIIPLRETTIISNNLSYYVVTRLQKIIVKKMAAGYTQMEVSHYLMRHEFAPNSLSTIEKELKKLKKQFRAKSTVHLIVILIRLGHLKI